MRWTPGEIDYLHRHAGDGAKAIARHLGRSQRSVVAQANRYGLSLRRRWQCGLCGGTTYMPLNREGWCRKCAVRESRDKAAIRGRRLQAEIMREREEVREAEKERQRIYSENTRKARKLRRSDGD